MEITGDYKVETLKRILARQRGCAINDVIITQYYEHKEGIDVDFTVPSFDAFLVQIPCHVMISWWAAMYN